MNLFVKMKNYDIISVCKKELLFKEGRDNE